MKYVSVIPKPITILQSRLFRDQNEHPVRCCVFCSQKINANVQVELASWHMYSKRRSNLVEMDVIKAFSVYPHVARKCCNMAKSTVQLQHEVITRKYLILSDSRRLFHRPPLARVFSVTTSFTTRETACQYRYFLFLWLYLHHMRNSFVCAKWSGALFFSL